MHILLLRAWRLGVARNGYNVVTTLYTERYGPSTASGEFGTALQFNVDFSNKGIIKPGFATKKGVCGRLAGQTMTQILAMAEAALSGNPTTLNSFGVSISQLTTLLGYYNGNYHNWTSNNGYLQ